MTESRDPLRKLWDAVESPPIHRALAEEDAATRAAVEWLQGAMARTAPAQAAPPPTGASRRPTWLRRLAPLAAAAALLLLARAALRDGRPEGLPETALIQAQTPAQPDPGQTVELLASDAHHLELRSGPVRLTLLHPKSRSNT